MSMIPAHVLVANIWAKRDIGDGVHVCVSPWEMSKFARALMQMKTCKRFRALRTLGQLRQTWGQKDFLMRDVLDNQVSIV